MANPIEILRVMNQAADNLAGLQRDIRSNAIAWKAAATTQSVPVGTLAGWMNAAASEYQRRLSWVTTLQADTPNWNAMASMWSLLGGSAADFNTMMNPLTSVANQLGPAPKTSYAQISSICDQITAGVPAPLSLWPE